MEILDIITVFEYQSIKVGHKDSCGKEFTKDHLKLLVRFRGEKDDDYFPYYTLIHNGVRFKQYVGILNVGGLQIEVLPKTDNSTNDTGLWRGHLITMLNTVYKLQTKAPTMANQRLKSSPILDVFLQRFLDEVERLLHVGLIKTYRQETGNRSSLKGKLLMSKHLMKNIVHKERFYVKYTTYDRNHLCNRILYKALKIIPEVTGNGYIINRARTLCFEFPELLEVEVNGSLFNTMKYDRKSEEYKNAIEIAKLILLNFMPDLRKGRNSVLALMFDMERLWEEYVYVMLKRKLTRYAVSAQQSTKFWERKTIRPDIVISTKDNTPLLVIDTKWKCPKDFRPSPGDLKQMYAYHRYWNVNNTILLYPATNFSRPIGGVFQDEAGKLNDGSPCSCEMIFANIDELV